MQTSNYGIADIFAHEGIVPFRYRDSVQVDTWGVGHTAPAGSPDPRTMPFGKEYPLTEVVDVFRRDVRKYEKRVAGAVKVPLKQNEFDALVSFDFNTGGIVKAQLTKSLNAGSRVAAADQFMGWIKPPEIIPRRKKEQALFRDGTYSSGGFASVIPADAKGRPLYAKGKRINVMPAIASMVAANGADAKADAERNKAAGAGAGGVATGGSTQVPDLPTDSATLKLFLIGLGILLVGAAVWFVVRSLRNRAEAKAHNDAAAAALSTELKSAREGT